jgi:ABC-type polysaccharide/polyol phosphate export permease
MYGVAETLAGRIPKAEEYIARVPAIGIVPWFLAGALFPITALPVVMTWIARFLPLTHALALVRYGLLDDRGALHDIWGMSSTGAIAGFAAALTVVSMRVFTRSAVG